MFQGEVRHHLYPEVSPVALHVGGKSNGNSRSLANDQLKVTEIQSLPALGELLGGSSQLGYVVRITPIYKPSSSADRGTTRSLGDLRSPWLVTTYPKWGDPPSKEPGMSRIFRSSESQRAQWLIFVQRPCGW